MIRSNHAEERLQVEVLRMAHYAEVAGDRRRAPVVEPNMSQLMPRFRRMVGASGPILALLTVIGSSACRETTAPSAELPVEFRRGFGPVAAASGSISALGTRCHRRHGSNAAVQLPERRKRGADRGSPRRHHHPDRPGTSPLRGVARIIRRQRPGARGSGGRVRREPPPPHRVGGHGDRLDDRTPGDRDGLLTRHRLRSSQGRQRITTSHLSANAPGYLAVVTPP